MGKSSNLNYLLNLVPLKKKKPKTTRNNLEFKHPCPASTFFFKFYTQKKPTFKSICFSLGVRYILFS